MEATILFILSFLGMNFLVFIPSWTIGIFAKINRPPRSIFEDSTYFILKRILYQRFSDDCFRLILELQALALFLLILDTVYSGYLKMIFVAVIMISFIYVTYISIIIKIFKKEPMFINDIDFAKTGFMVYKKMIPAVLTSIFISIIIVTFISYYLTHILIENAARIEQSWPLIIFLLLSIILSFISIKKVNYDIYHSCVSFSVINHVAFNSKKCSSLKTSLKTLNTEKPYEYANNITLKKTPNIIFVFLESYGSFVFSEPKYGEVFKKKMNDINKSLTKNRYHVVSTLSDSPVTSGGSWLSHSSVLFGAKVKDIAAHEIIFSQTEYVAQLASLPKHLKKHGYKSTLTTTLTYHKNEINWEKVNNAYPFDNMMLHDDFEFVGQKVNIYGDTYTLPDEYTINYAYNKLRKESPFFLCINTINSHHKFVSPISTKKNWKDYNTTAYKVTDGLTKNNLKNYFTAINYQLDYLRNFLLNNDLDDTITVLIGDHQPPFIAPADSNMATPIHIISKHKEFIEIFKEFNFTEGLVSDHISQKHESFFSKFLNALNRAYGENTDMELPIFEEGINLY